MKFSKLDIGLWIISPEPFEDERGFFARIFCKENFFKNDIGFTPVQISISYNAKRGTLRGLHFQKPPKEEDKIVFCMRGAVFDVAVDIRKGSKTFGKWVGVILHDGRDDIASIVDIIRVSEPIFAPPRSGVFIPKGFAHGFITLSDDVELLYMMDEFYSPEHSAGIRWNDPDIAIRWPIEPCVISTKDKELPFLRDLLG